MSTLAPKSRPNYSYAVLTTHGVTQPLWASFL